MRSNERHPLHRSLRAFRAIGGCLFGILWRSLGILLLAGVILVWNNRHDLSALNPFSPPSAGSLGPALNDEGLKLLADGDPAGALAKFEQALEIVRGQDDRSPEPTLLINEALAYDDLGEGDRVIMLYEQAAAIDRDLGDRDAEARCLSDLGVQYANLNRVPEALEMQQRALMIFRDTKNETGQADCLTHIGQLSESLGQWDHALAAEQEALVLWRTGRDPTATAVPSSVKPGENDSAAARLVKQLGAEALFRNRQGEAAVLIDLASNYLHQNKPEEAATYLAQALFMARDIDDRVLELTVLFFSSKVAEATGNHDQALDLRAQALAIAREIKDRPSESQLLNYLAADALAAHRYDEMRPILEESLAIARELRDARLQATASYYLARLSEEQGNPADALVHLRQALDLLEQVRAGAGVDDLRVNALDEYAFIYTDAVRLLSKQGLAEEAFSTSERARARTFLDQASNGALSKPAAADPELTKQEQTLRAEIAALDKKLRHERAKPRDSQNQRSIGSWDKDLAAKQAEYTLTLAQLKLADPRYASMLSGSPLQLREIQQLLNPETTLLSYYVAGNQPLAFIITRDSFRSVPLDVTVSQLNNAIFEFRQFAGVGAEPPSSVRQLYGWLVAPVRSQLTTPVVGVIPHNIINYVPLGALYDGSRYFAEDYDLFYLPSASALPLVQAKRKQGGEPVLLSVAYSQPAGLPALRFADAEARAVAELFGGAALTGSDATEQALEERTAGVRILHLAAHAEANDANPLFSRVLLAPDPAGDGALNLAEVYHLDLGQADLVVLSACQTQIGARGGGDDMLALSRAFILAGSPSVVASLWNVDDQATSDLMLAFYRNLKAGAGKAAALRAAQNEIRARYPNPYYWAAFTLIGDPGVSSTAGY